VIHDCHDNGRKIGLCGQAPSDFPEFAQWLVGEGIDSISLNADVVLLNMQRMKEMQGKSQPPETVVLTSDAVPTPSVAVPHHELEQPLPFEELTFLDILADDPPSGPKGDDKKKVGYQIRVLEVSCDSELEHKGTDSSQRIVPMD
jgi:hypothetical protein